MSVLRKKILILGGSGLLGSHCVQFFKNEYDVYWTYSKKQKQPQDQKAFQFDYNDNNNFFTFLDKLNPNIIINCIGFVSVDESEKNKKLAFKLNSEFIRDIIQNLNNKRSSALYIQISSGGVYGNRFNKRDEPWNENDPLQPLSNYAKSKLRGEDETKNYNGPYLILRTDFYGLNLFKDELTLLSWIIKNAKYKEKIIGWENIYFSPISAIKLCETINKLILKKVTGIFNIGSKKGCNKFEFVEKTCTYLGIEPNLSRKSITSTIRPYYSVLNTQKIESIIDFNCNWRTDLKKYLKGLKKDMISNL